MITLASAYPDVDGRHAVVVDLMSTKAGDVSEFRSRMTLPAVRELHEELATAIAILESRGDIVDT